ncbi:HK97 family phage prohead protease [Ramlibacter sp. MAHUQ-53]|uniref:HK97 family phage prohead protease n=1 Tax=unclassified Ramlibacter TaxID=2617605 RepID=UPI0036434BAF
MLVKKTLAIHDVSLKMEGDTGKFAGYASVFGGVDSYGDTIVKGAFEYSLKKFGKPKMFFNHAWDMPIGKWTVAKEDDHGLYVEGELTPGLALSADVRAAMTHGTLDGLSIGGLLKKGDYEETDSGRVIRRWSNLMEVSPVVFPADGAARIDLASVKSEDLEAAIAEIETVRDFERFLRDAGGVSKGAAIALVARAKVVFSEGEPGQTPDAKAMEEVAQRLARLASLSV